jgi:hypothetical protein
MSEPKPVNVSIANVISWYEESESCLLHNHAERIPVTKINDTDIVQSIIDNNYC